MNTAQVRLPVSFEDIASGTFNELITPGGTAILSGRRLRFDRSDVRQGIFLTGGAGEIRIERVLSHSATKVVFMLPIALPADSYKLEVRVLPKNNKEVKKGSLPEILSV